MKLHADWKGARLFSIFFRAATLVYFALFWLFTYLTVVRVPILDLMDWSIFYLQTGRSGHWWTYLWQPHNEHRIPISRLLVAAHIEFFHGSGIPFFIFGAFACLAIVGVLIREFFLNRLPAELRLAMIADQDSQMGCCQAKYDHAVDRKFAHDNVTSMPTRNLRMQSRKLRSLT